MSPDWLRWLSISHSCSLFQKHPNSELEKKSTPSQLSWNVISALDFVIEYFCIFVVKFKISGWPPNSKSQKCRLVAAVGLAHVLVYHPVSVLLRYMICTNLNVDRYVNITDEADCTVNTNKHAWSYFPSSILNTISPSWSQVILAHLDKDKPSDTTHLTFQTFASVSNLMTEFRDWKRIHSQSITTSRSCQCDKWEV